MVTPTESDKSTTSPPFTFALCLTPVFVALCGWAISHHEMWRDEWEFWLRARESQSISDLFFGPGLYMNHPKIWLAILHAASRFTHDPVAMQALHVFFAALAVFILARWGPFTRTEKCLFTLGYYPLFEYGVISRNYAIGLAGLFLVAAVYKTRRRSYIPLGVSIAVAASTNIHAAMILCCLILALSLELVLDPEIRRGARNRKLDVALGLSLMLGGIAFSVWQSLPPSDSFWARNNEVKFSLERTVSAVCLLWNAYVPLPALTIHSWWNTNITWDPTLPSWTTGGIALLTPVLLVPIVALLWGHPWLLTSWFAGTAGLVGFSFFRYWGSLRHHGHLFLLFFICLWLTREQERRKWNDELSSQFFQIADRHGRKIVAALLAVHVAAAGLALHFDRSRPFSEARRAAEWIEANGWRDRPIVASNDACCQGIAGWLSRKLYYPETDSLGTYPVWNGRDRWYIPDYEVLADVNRLLSGGNPEVLLVLNHELSVLDKRLAVAELARFTRSIVYNEMFFLYRVQHRNLW